MVTREEREQFQADRLTELSKKDGRSLVLFGSAHVQAIPPGGELPLGVPTLADRLLSGGNAVATIIFQTP